MFKSIIIITSDLIDILENSYMHQCFQYMMMTCTVKMFDSFIACYFLNGRANIV